MQLCKFKPMAFESRDKPPNKFSLHGHKVPTWTLTHGPFICLRVWRENHSSYQFHRIKLSSTLYFADGVTLILNNCKYYELVIIMIQIPRVHRFKFVNTIDVIYILICRYLIIEWPMCKSVCIYYIHVYHILSFFLNQKNKNLIKTLLLFHFFQSLHINLCIHLFNYFRSSTYTHVYYISSRILHQLTLYSTEHFHTE